MTALTQGQLPTVVLPFTVEEGGLRPQLGPSSLCSSRQQSVESSAVEVPAFAIGVDDEFVFVGLFASPSGRGAVAAIRLARPKAGGS